MRRLTHRDENGKAAVWLYSEPNDAAAVIAERAKKEQEVVERLAEYEDTGLTPAKIKPRWHRYPEERPTDDNEQYLIANDFGYGTFYSVAHYSHNLYKTDEHDFYEYKKKKKAGFYRLSDECGYYEPACQYWADIEPPEVGK